MERLTETKFEREMRIGFAMIDRHFDDAIVKLDALKKEYERKLPPNASDLLAQIHQAMGLIRSGQASYENNFLAIKQSHDLDLALNHRLRNAAYQNALFQSRYGGYTGLLRSRIFD